MHSHFATTPLVSRASRHFSLQRSSTAHTHNDPEQTRRPRRATLARLGPTTVLAVALLACLSARPAFAGLKYFGYAAATGDEALRRTVPYTNFTFIGTHLGDSTLAATVQNSVGRGQAIILQIQPVFWNDPTELCSTGPALRYDWVSRWNQFVAENAALLTPSHISYLALYDEPFHSQIDMFGFDAVAAQVKQTLPWVKIFLYDPFEMSQLICPSNLAVFQYFAAGGRLSNVDLLAVDYYWLHPLTDPMYSQVIAGVKTRFPGKSWAYVMTGFWTPPDFRYHPLETPFSGDIFGQDPSVMAEIAEEWYTAAAADPDAVLLGVSQWPSDPPTLGSDQLPPAVLTAHERIGKRIIANASFGEMIYNEGFEYSGASDLFGGWQFVSSGYGSGTVTAIVASGNRRAQVTVAAPGDVFLTTSIGTGPYPQNSEGRAIPVEPNHVYRVHAWLLSSGGAQAGLRIIEFGADGQIAMADRFLANGGGSGVWEWLSSDFMTGPYTDHVAIRLSHHISTGVFQWDGVSLQSLNIVQNPSFESTLSTAGWWFPTYSGSATHSVVTSPVHSGSHAIKVTVYAPGDLAVETNPALLVEPGQDYLISAFLNSSTGTAGCLRVIESDKLNGFVADRWLTCGGASGQWQQLATIFRVSPGTAFVRVRLMQHIGTGVYTWDDISLNKMLDP